MTDKFKNIYDGVSVNQFGNALTMIDNATRYDSEMALTDSEKIALARILAYEGINGDGGHYAHAVDFLWMAHRVSTASKIMLLNLMDEYLLDMLNDGEKRGEKE